MVERRTGTFKDLKVEVSERRKKILVESAKKMMLRSGVRETTLRQIAAEANVTTGALYHHFRNQHHILAAVYVDAIDEIVARIDGIQDDPTLKTNEERVRELARRYLTYVIENGCLVDIRSSMFYEQNFDEDARRMMDEANERLLERFKANAISSRFKEVEFTQRLAEVLWALLNGLLVTHRRSREDCAKVLELADQAFDLWFLLGKGVESAVEANVPAGARTRG